MKKIKLSFLLAVIIFSFAACKNADNNTESSTLTTSIAKRSENIVAATLWYQQSAEMQALYYQTYNLAKNIVSTYKAKAGETRKPAVVLDIDETVLDNSPFQANCILNDSVYSSSRWQLWVEKECAKALPGVVNFTQFAQNNGFEVFYISNRKVNQLQATINNLLKEGLPNADSAHVLLKTESSSKTERRSKVEENYVIELLIGDNLLDLADMFENRTDNYGKNLVEQNAELFGIKFLILPNPMYGHWLDAIYNYRHDLTATQEDSIRKANLISVDF